jgi:voltage-dependent anion channel protein 2
VKHAYALPLSRRLDCNRPLTLFSLFRLSYRSDLLSDDFVSGVTLKCKKAAGPVAVTIETVQGDGGALSSKIGTKFAYAKFNVDKGQLNADGGRVLETSLSVSPEIKLSFKANKGADLGVDYVKGNFCATGVLDVMDMSKVTTSACVGLSNGLKVGGDATYGLSGAGLTGFSVGGSYTAGPLFTSLTATNKLSTFNIGLLYKVSDEMSLASQTTHTSDKVCDVVALGLAYKAPGVGLMKAKMGSNGILSAALVREIAPAVTLTASGTVSPSDLSTFKPGLSISM